MNLTELIKNAGVVGAGGAGFPTHVKSDSSVEYVLANGAECEPLLHKDYEIMLNFAEPIVRGFEMMVDKTGAKKGYFGIKGKNAKAIDEVKKHLPSNIEMTELGDFYPSGDEYELVYAATKRLIPAGGIPLQVGCVVNNVETLYNVWQAAQGIPVTEKFVCVAGCVKNPSSFFVPIGTPMKEVLKMAGGVTVQDYGVFVSGIMMGQLSYNTDEPVTKTTAGYIVLPKSHHLITRKETPEPARNKIGKSACDQCSYCTEFCPRYLLGYNVQPHKVMRSLGFTKTGNDIWNQMAELCCACGLCTLYACPEDLFPKEACDKSKREMKEAGIKYVQPNPPKVHPLKEGRRVPLKMLMKRLKVTDFDAPTPFIKADFNPGAVKIMTKQHTGAPAVPVVRTGQRVAKNELIAAIDEGKLGANIHASISGIVTEVNSDFIRIDNH